MSLRQRLLQARSGTRDTPISACPAAMGIGSLSDLPAGSPPWGARDARGLLVGLRNERGLSLLSSLHQPAEFALSSLAAGKHHSFHPLLAGRPGPAGTALRAAPEVVVGWGHQAGSLHLGLLRTRDLHHLSYKRAGVLGGPVTTRTLRQGVQGGSLCPSWRPGGPQASLPPASLVVAHMSAHSGPCARAGAEARSLFWAEKPL